MRKTLLVVMCLAVTGAALAAGPDTHVGQPASQLVTLYGSCDSIVCNPILMRVLANGKPQTCPSGREAPLKCGFSPPDGMVLIVTDVDWEFQSTGPVLGIVSLSLDVENPGLFQYSSSVRLSASQLFQDVHNPFTTGFVVPSKVRLLPEYQKPITNDFFRYDLWVHGYLVADK